MAGLRVAAGIFLTTFGIAQDEAVFRAVLAHPFQHGRGEFRLGVLADEVDGKAGLVLVRAGVVAHLRDLLFCVCERYIALIVKRARHAVEARALVGVGHVGAGNAHREALRARRGISYGFQQPPRFKGIRVKDLLTIASGQKFLPRGEACKYLTQVGLCAADYLDREVDASLSGGEVKRIEIATILARQPQLMILDEPEAGIDLWSFARLTETFEEIHTRQDCTMVIISHQERIISLADEILVIDKGVIARRGTRDEVFTDIVHSTTGGCPVIYGEAKK